MAVSLSSDQFSLKWNNFSSNLTSGFLSHLSDKDLVDVTLAVEGQLLQAHKLVLSVCSPYFKNIFKINPCQHPVVILQDMGFTEVDALLRFMYQGEVNVKQEDLATFLKVAETLQIKGLTGEEKKYNESVSRSSTPSHCSNDASEICLNVDKKTSPSDADAIVKHTRLAEVTAKTKRPQDTTAHAIPSSKKNRTSPPPLKDLDVPILSPQSITAKIEPPDYEEQDDPFFIKENLEDLLTTKKDLGKESINLEKSDNTNNRGQQFSSNSVIDASCLQGDSATSEKIRRRGEQPWLHVGGYIYHKDSVSGTRIYWRCRYHSKILCKARCVTNAGVVLKSSGDHNHVQETTDTSSFLIAPHDVNYRTNRYSNQQ